MVSSALRIRECYLLKKKIARRRVRDDALLEPEGHLFALDSLNPHPASRRAHRGVPCAGKFKIFVGQIMRKPKCD